MNKYTGRLLFAWSLSPSFFFRFFFFFFFLGVEFCVVFLQPLGFLAPLDSRAFRWFYVGREGRPRLTGQCRWVGISSPQAHAGCT